MTIRNIKLLLFGISLLGLAGAASAQFERLPTTNPGPHAAQVVGTPGFPNQDLFEVRFVGIDGRNISPRETLWLQPGTYELRVVVDAAFTRSGPIINPRRRGESNIIEVELEAGKQYRILARYNRGQGRDSDFSIILHKVEE